MRRTAYCFLGVFVLMAVATAPAFQQAAPGMPTAAEPSKEVVLDVVADDGHGQLVGDLNRDDFQVFEDGKQQTVSSFERHREGSQPVLILLDVLNTRLASRGRAQQQIAAALENLESAEKVFLYVLASDAAVQAVHAMPENAQTQKEVTPWTRDVRALLDQALRQANTLRPASMETESPRTEATYKALREIASRLADFPGRKTIVWVTHGVPLAAANANGLAVDYEQPLQRSTAAFGQAGIVVYPVAQTEGALPDSMVGLSSSATLRRFADLTGGRLFPSDHIDDAISQALADSRLSYRLGYLPPPGKAGAGYRKIRVVCTRHGIRAQTRQGYYP